MMSKNLIVRALNIDAPDKSNDNRIIIMHFPAANVNSTTM